MSVEQQDNRTLGSIDNDVAADRLDVYVSENNQNSQSVLRGTTNDHRGIHHITNTWGNVDGDAALEDYTSKNNPNSYITAATDNHNGISHRMTTYNYTQRIQANRLP